jgi:hypothetical protein
MSQPQPIGIGGKYWTPSTRCEAAADDVHHLTYERLAPDCSYPGAAEDLIHLCRRHHLMRHVMAMRCFACGEPVVAWEDEALDWVDGADPEGGLEAIVEDLGGCDLIQAWGLWTPEATWVCQACSQPFLKDD